jgi:hypothetical protein
VCYGLLLQTRQYGPTLPELRVATWTRPDVLQRDLLRPAHQVGGGRPKVSFYFAWEHILIFYRHMLLVLLFIHTFINYNFCLQRQD